MSDDDNGSRRRDKFKTERRDSGGGGGKSSARGRSPDGVGGHKNKRMRQQGPPGNYRDNNKPYNRQDRRDGGGRGHQRGGHHHRRNNSGGGGGNPRFNGRRGPRFNAPPPPHMSPGFRGQPGPRGPWKSPNGGPPGDPNPPPPPALNLDKLKLNIKKFFDLHKDDAWFREKYHPSVVEARKETKQEWYKRRIALFKYLIEGNLLASLDLSSKSQPRVRRLMAKINVALNTDFEDWETELPKIFVSEPPRQRRTSDQQGVAPPSNEAADGNVEPQSEASAAVAAAADGAEDAAAAAADGAEDGAPVPDVSNPSGTGVVQNTNTEEPPSSENNESSEQPAPGSSGESSTTATDDAAAAKEPEAAAHGASLTQVALSSDENGEFATTQPAAAPADDEQLDYNEDNASKPENPDDAADDAADDAGEQQAGGRPRFVKVCCSGIPVSISKEDFVSAFSSTEGFVRVAIADPNQMNPMRVAWLTFTKEVPITTLIATVRGTPLEEHNLKFHQMEGGPGVVRIADAFRRKDDRVLAITLGCLLDEEAGMYCDTPDTTNPYFDKERTDDEILMYLRVVHSYDFYNANEFLIENDLSDRCCTIHLRKSGRVPVHYTDTWRPRVNQRIQLGKVTKASPKRLGEVTVEGEKERFLYKNTEKLSEFVWRCKLHPADAKKKKMFKSKEFLAKHLANKHPQEMQKVEQDTAYFNNYVHDPNRPLFFTSAEAPLSSPPGPPWNPPPRMPPPRAMRPPFSGPPPVFGSLSRRQVASYSGVTAPSGPAMI